MCVKNLVRSLRLFKDGGDFSRPLGIIGDLPSKGTAGSGPFLLLTFLSPPVHRRSSFALLSTSVVMCYLATGPAAIRLIDHSLESLNREPKRTFSHGEMVISGLVTVIES